MGDLVLDRPARARRRQVEVGVATGASQIDDRLDRLLVRRHEADEVFRGCRMQRHYPTLLTLVGMSLPSTTRSRLPGLVLVLAGLLALPLMTAVGQAAAAPVIGDAGAFVRWGLLYAKFVQDLAAAATVGLLVHAAFLVPETTRTHRRITATRQAALAAGLWALAGIAGA